MTDKAISPLRQRIIEDVTIRKLASQTQHNYVQRVKHFAAFLGRSPDTASFEDVRRYQLHLAAGGTGIPTLNQNVSTLRFFFRTTLGRADILNHTQFMHVPRKLPVVLSPEEVARFLDAAPGLSTRADNIAQARRLLDVPAEQLEAGDDSRAKDAELKPLSHPCPCCGGRMVVIETFQRAPRRAIGRRHPPP